MLLPNRSMTIRDPKPTAELPLEAISVEPSAAE
ncbi:MAG: hypothetical protein ACI82F_004621, partial [Planctomycetota bacterium]